MLPGLGRSSRDRARRAREPRCGSGLQHTVVLHDRGAASAERVAALAQASGAVGRVVVPFGDYGFTASGMELAGICWYRTVSGFAGPDPISAIMPSRASTHPFSISRPPVNSSPARSTSVLKASGRAVAPGHG